MVSHCVLYVGQKPTLLSASIPDSGGTRIVRPGGQLGFSARRISPHPKPRCVVSQCTELHSAYDGLRFTAYEPVGQSYRADTIQPLRHVVGKASPSAPPMVSPLTCSSAPNPLRCHRYPLHCAAALSSPHVAITPASRESGVGIRNQITASRLWFARQRIHRTMPTIALHIPLWL